MAQAKQDSILWAIDPFQKPDNAWKRSVELVNESSKKFKCRVRPIYVAELSNSRLKKLVNAHGIEGLEAKVKKYFSANIKGSRISALDNIRVLLDSGSDLMSDVETVEELVEREHPQFVVVSAGGKSGL